MADSNARKILEAAVTAIQDLNLTGVSDANIKAIEAAETAEELEGCFTGKPYIALMIVDGETIDALGPSPVEYDDVGYPVFVGIVACRTADDEATDDAQRLWRQTIRTAFIRQRLVSGATTLAHTCIFEPRPAVNARMRRLNNIWSSSFVLRFHTREART